MLIAIVALFPVAFFSYAIGLYSPWMWMLRILCAFVAGAISFYVVKRVPRTSRNRAIASHIVLAAALLAIAACYVMAVTGKNRYSGILIPILVLIVAALGLADRHIARILGTKFFVVGGMASYSIYLVHMPVIEIIWFLQGRFSMGLGTGTPGAIILFAIVPFLVSGLGYTLWRWFEEPARRKIRIMSTQNLPERAADDPAIT